MAIDLLDILAVAPPFTLGTSATSGGSVVYLWPTVQPPPPPEPPKPLRVVAATARLRLVSGVGRCYVRLRPTVVRVPPARLPSLVAAVEQHAAYNLDETFLALGLIEMGVLPDEAELVVEVRVLLEEMCKGAGLRVPAVSDETIGKMLAEKLVKDDAEKLVIEDAGAGV